MPENIKTFTSPIDQLHPSDKGIEAWQMEGRRVGSFYHQIGEVANQAIRQTGDEVDTMYSSKLANDYSAAFAQASQSWNETAKSADPNDPNTADKWRQSVLEPMLEKLGEDAPTQNSSKMANRYRNELRNHFTDVTIADQSRLAGTAVDTNLQESLNNFSNAVVSDPTQLPMALSSMRALTDAQISSHALNASDADSVRKGLFSHQRQIVVAGIESAAQQNPAFAKKMLASGDYDNYITGQEKDYLNGYADTHQRLADTQARANAAEARKADHIKAQSELSALTVSTIGQDGDMHVTPDYFKTIAKIQLEHPEEPPGAFRSAIAMGQRIIHEAETKTKTVSDPNTYADLKDRMFLDESDPRHLTDEDVIRARADGLLSNNDYTFFTGAMSKMQKDPDYKYAHQEYSEFIKNIKSSITRSNIMAGTNDVGGDQRYLQFMQQADSQFDKAYHDGTWRSLLERSNKQGLWAQATRFMVGPNTTMNEMQQSTQGSVGLVPQINGQPPAPKPAAAPKPAQAAVTRRNPGESIADYDKRTGGR